MEKLRKYLLKAKKQTERDIDGIPETFDCLEDSENWNYYDGYLSAINGILDFINKNNVYYSLTAILMQELFENGLFNVEELADKYTMSKEQKTALKELYKEYFEE